MKRLKTALLISLAVNIFLAGLLIGAYWPKKPVEFVPENSPVAEVMTPEKRAFYEERMAEAVTGFQYSREQLDAAREKFMTALGQEEFSRPQLQAIAEDMVRHRVTPFQSMLKTVTDMAEEMTAAERRAVAEDITLRREAYKARQKCE